MLLQRHNFMRAPRPGFLGAPSRLFHARQLAALDGLTFVSQAARDDFERDWPEVETPRWVAPNGVDCAEWRPTAERESLALVVGRATPEKGLLEAAEALAVVLPAHPEWSAAFVVAGAERGADYLTRLREALAPLTGRARVLTDIAFAEVKALNEKAAIALVPSKWREPFGRTCLEALAGGAALITSGSGGLKEIAGEAALYVPDAAPAGLAEALRTLIADADLRRRLLAKGERGQNAIRPATRRGKARRRLRGCNFARSERAEARSRVLSLPNKGLQTRLLTSATLRLNHNHLGSDLHPVVKIDHVVVHHPDAARRHVLADRPRLVGAVDAIHRRSQVERAGAERVANAAVHVPGQIGTAQQHFRRRRPAGPFGLAANGFDARPFEARTADADAVAQRAAAGSTR